MRPVSVSSYETVPGIYLNATQYTQVQVFSLKYELICVEKNSLMLINIKHVSG